MQAKRPSAGKQDLKKVFQQHIKNNPVIGEPVPEDPNAPLPQHNPIQHPYKQSHSVRAPQQESAPLTPPGQQQPQQPQAQVQVTETPQPLTPPSPAPAPVQTQVLPLEQPNQWQPQAPLPPQPSATQLPRMPKPQMPLPSQIGNAQQVSPMTTPSDGVSMVGQPPQMPVPPPFHGAGMANMPPPPPAPPVTQLPPAVEQPITPTQSLQFYQSEDRPEEYDERIALPSNFIFYNFDSVSVRFLKVRDLVSINHATLKSDLTLLIDALNGTINQDIRDLTVQDFFYLIYWHRMYSYPSNPYTVPWTSQYGNKNVTELTKSDLEIITIKMTRDEYVEKYLSKNICAPTVRDWETKEASNLSEEDTWQYDLAQHMIGSTPQEKINLLNEQSADFVSLVRQFSKDSEHGVRESVVVNDAHFKPIEALAYLNDRLASVATVFAEMESHKAFDMMLESFETIKELIDERDRIKDALDRGVEVQPNERTIHLGMAITELLP